MIRQMTPYELMDLALSLSNRIDTHWALFISVHLALIGGIIYVDRPLSKREKFGALTVYSGFAVINFYMMKSQATFLASIYQQIINIKDEICCKGNAVIEHVVGLYQMKSTEMLELSVIIVHAVMLGIIFLTIIYDKKLSKPKVDGQ